jgi:hypothetical protein
MSRMTCPNNCDAATVFSMRSPASAGLLKVRRVGASSPAARSGRRTPADRTARADGPPNVARLAEVRRQIAAGTYLTDDKLDTAVNRLLDALRQGARSNTTAVA